MSIPGTKREHRILDNDNERCRITPLEMHAGIRLGDIRHELMTIYRESRTYREVEKCKVVWVGKLYYIVESCKTGIRESFYHTPGDWNQKAYVDRPPHSEANKRKDC